MGDPRLSDNLIGNIHKEGTQRSVEELAPGPSLAVEGVGAFATQIASGWVAE
jgi:hypothetical protein